MVQTLKPPIGPIPAEHDFLLALQLAEGPPGQINIGIGQWKPLYEMASEADDSFGMITALQNIYSCLNSAGRSSEALLCARRLLALGGAVGDPLVVGHALNNIAWAYWVMGDAVSAFGVAREAFEHAVTLKNKPLIHPLTGPEAIRTAATELLHLIRMSRGQLRRAVADQKAALRIYRERAEPSGIVSALEGLGLVHKDLGDYVTAARYFLEGLHETEQSTFPNAQARLLARAGLLGNLAVVLTYQGDTASALAHIEEGTVICRALSDQFGLIGLLGQKGRALLRAGQVRESIDALESMLRLARDFSASSWCHAAHINLARAHLTMGARTLAAYHCEQATELAKEKHGHIDVEHYWLRAVIFHPRATVEQRDGDISRFVALAYHAVEALHDAVRGSLPEAVIARWIDAFETLLDAVFGHLPCVPLQLATSQQDTTGTLAGI